MDRAGLTLTSLGNKQNTLWGYGTMRQEPSIVRNWVYVFSRDLIPEHPKHIEREHLIHTKRARMSIGGKDKLLDGSGFI